MSKKTLNKIFDEKINKEEIRENILNKANKHSVDYFKIVKVGILVGCIVLIVFLSMNGRNDTPVGDSLIKYDDSIKSNTNKLINDSQYAFIGLVTEDKDNNDFYKVIVYENIKGELVKAPAIEVKGDNVLLEVTSIYLFTAQLENHDLVLKNQENANLLITLGANNTYDSNSLGVSDEIKEKIKIIKDEYNKNVDYTDTYEELSKYDVNYKE